MPGGVPNPTTITDRPGFAQALTQLRERARLTVRDVARTAGLQASTADASDRGASRMAFLSSRSGVSGCA